MGELLQPRHYTHTALLQLFTLQLSTPDPPANDHFEKVSDKTPLDGHKSLV